MDGADFTAKPADEGSNGDSNGAPADSTKQGCLGLVVIAVILTIGFAICGDSDSTNKSDGMAYVMCQSFVEDRLKAPASAGFANKSEATITETGEDQWRIRAHVDSQNSFGANVRTPFVCEIKYVGDDKWQLVDLTLQE